MDQVGEAELLAAAGAGRALACGDGSASRRVDAALLRRCCHELRDRIDLALDGGGTSSMWWATKNEWLGLIDVAGLEVEALYGGFAGEPFTGERSEYVFVARRPASRET